MAGRPTAPERLIATLLANPFTVPAREHAEAAAELAEHDVADAQRWTERAADPTQRHRAVLAVMHARALRAPEIPVEVATVIRRRCAMDWPRDARIRAYCEYQQLDAWYQLNRGMGVPAAPGERWQLSAFDGSTHRFFVLAEPVDSLERCVAEKLQVESRYPDVTLRCHQLP